MKRILLIEDDTLLGQVCAIICMTMVMHASG